MRTSKNIVKAGMILSGAVLAIAGISTAALTSHADTASYKQAFSAGDTSVSGIFNVANDESGITYTLNGSSNAMLECYASNGSLLNVANLSGSGTINSSSIMLTASNCNPSITTTAHLIQDMREGKIYFVNGGTTLSLTSAAISMTPPTITATSTPVTTGGGSMSTSTATTTMATMPASDLRVALNVLLREHVSSSIDVLRNISDNSPALTASLAAQDQNAVDLANAVASVYGTSAGNTFLQIFRAHIADSNAYTEGIKDGSITNQQAALSALDMQLQNLASFFATANPNVPYDGLLAALRQHEILVNDASVSYSQGNYVDSYNYEMQALTQISGGADVLANAIVMQYPAVFTK